MKQTNLLIAAILFLTLTIQVTGQTFQRTYGSSKDDKGTQLLVTPDSNLAIIGTSGEKSGVYLTKTDKNGNSIWQKNYTSSYALNNPSFKRTADNGFIIAGTAQYSTDQHPNICLIKTNAVGDTLWTKFYAESGASEIITTSDGGYAILGYQRNTEDQNILLLKTDVNGTIQWAKTYGGNAFDQGYSIKQTADGSYIIAGTTYSFGQGNEDVYLLKVNSIGNLLWTKTFGTEGLKYDHASHIEITKDGGFIVAGTSSDPKTGGLYDTDLFLLKTDSLGNSNWSYLYGGDDHEIGTSVRQTPDGRYIATGYTYSSGKGQADVYLLNIDALGSVLWSKNYGGASGEQGNDVIQFGSSYIIAGETRNFSMGLNDIYLIKTDSLGNDTCKQGNAITSKVIQSWKLGTGGVEHSVTLLTSVIKIVSNNGNMTAHDPCVCVPPIANFHIDMLDVTARTKNLSTWATTWHWDFGNGDTSNIEEPVYNWKVAGKTFKVCLTVKNSCGEDSTCQTITTGTGINEFKNNQLKLHIAPNPFDTFTSIKFENAKGEKLNLQMLNALGQVVSQINNITDNNVQIDRNGLPKGLYFIHVLKDNQVIGADKIIIE